MFLTETSTRHSLLTKQKHFRAPQKKGLQSNSQKLTGGTTDTAIEVEDVPAIRREESEEDALNLQDLPAADDFPAVEDLSDADSLFADDDGDGPRASKRARAATNESSEPLPKRRAPPEEEANDDKKKMAMETSYDGFAIYGRVLCLVVKRKDKKGKGPAKTAGQAMMEDWITSTQLPAQEDEG
jgi:hypothetical protein